MSNKKQLKKMEIRKMIIEATSESKALFEVPNRVIAKLLIYNNKVKEEFKIKASYEYIRSEMLSISEVGII